MLLKPQRQVSEQAFAEAQNAAAVNAADNAALRERVKVLEDAERNAQYMGMDEDEWNKPTFDQARRTGEEAMKIAPRKSRACTKAAFLGPPASRSSRTPRRR